MPVTYACEDHHGIIFSAALVSQELLKGIYRLSAPAMSAYVAEPWGSQRPAGIGGNILCRQ